MNSFSIDLSNTKIRLIIISLILVLILMFSILLLISNQQSTSSNENTSANSDSLYAQSETQNPISTFPTGIILPEEEISEADLDILSIKPLDGQLNVAVNTNIEIIFNRNIASNEVSFSSVPKIISNLQTVDNKLIITPVENLTPGTLYSFRVIFSNNSEKIRLYRFSTEGVTSGIMPDTREEEVKKEYENFERVNRPDIYVANNTPFENADFIATSDFEPSVPSRYYLIINAKNTNEEQVTASVNVWLQSLGLTAEQIANLDIRFN